MPDLLARQRNGNSFTARLLVTWGDSGSPPWVSFGCNLVAVEKGVPGEVLKAARRYFESTWAEEDQSALSKVAPEWLMEQPEGLSHRSPLRAYLPGSREEILWKSSPQAFELVSAPSFIVNNVYSSPSGPYAMCQMEYEVEEKDAQPGKAQRQAVVEEARLEAAGSGNWLVSWASRRPVRAQSAAPEITARDEVLGAVAKAGPFESVRSPYYGQKWSDDGEWFAFTGAACGINGIWAASRDGSRLVNLIGLEGTDVWLLDWAPGQHRVRFLSYGYHSRGPHADKTGYWVAEADLDTQEVCDIAFVRYPRVSFPRDVALPEGRRYVVFRATPDLWRADMETGETLRIASGDAVGDGLLALRYSPSSSLCA